jgi:N-acetylglucosaminyldiphosphoundecaprenol N-acetyl-beta-D-mannosaminyltransferase
MAAASDPELVSARATLLNCSIDRLDMASTLDRCRAVIEEQGYAEQVSINASKIVALQRDAQLRALVDAATIVSADGQSVVWASRLLRDPLPERVPGVELMASLLDMAARAGYSVYVLGARADVLDRAVLEIGRRFPGIAIAGYRDGYFQAEESDDVAAEIRASRADILFIAMSSPRKEHFLARYGPSLGVRFAMGVGGSIDIMAGLTRRAPQAWQRLGLEWLYRVLQEPRRMTRRYLVTNAQFLWLLARAVVRGGARPPAPDRRRSNGERPHSRTTATPGLACAESESRGSGAD